MSEKVIGFIGGGNMAGSLVGGLIADGCGTDKLWIAEPDANRREQLRANFGVKVVEDNAELVAGADVVVLAVKPQSLRDVCSGIADAVGARKPLLISVAAGVRTGDLLRWLGSDKLSLVRTMPNTPALVQSGATALFATPQVSASQREQAEGILRSVGLTLWLDDEQQMDAVTAVSGSGPAYFFLVMEAMEQAATELGLPAKTARLLTLQTAFGAAKMALESSADLTTLRQRVTSPGGTTEKAIGVLENGELRQLFGRALAAARDRSEELAQLLGSDK